MARNAMQIEMLIPNTLKETEKKFWRVGRFRFRHMALVWFFGRDVPKRKLARARFDSEPLVRPPSRRTRPSPKHPRRRKINS